MSSSPPTFGVAEGERIARDLYGLAVSVDSLSGERDCNFHLRTGDGRDFVLKILDVGGDLGTVECLVESLSCLAEQDRTLPIPHVFATLEGRDIGRFDRNGVEYAALLLTFLPGRLLARSTPGEAMLEELGETLGRLDRALQGFFHPTLARRLAWDVRRLPELARHAELVESPATRADIERVTAAVRECLPKLRAVPNQAIHGDCHANNVLVDIDTLKICGILDFGDMIHAPRILEPAVAMSELLTANVVPLDTVDAVLRGFVQSQPVEAGEVELLFDLITARHAVGILIHSWRCRHDVAGACLLEDAAEHAQRSLAQLLKIGREQLSRSWHGVAGTARALSTRGPVGHASTIDLARRHRLLGAGAELFYDEPLHLVRGNGVWLYDRHGIAYLDAYNNVPHVGHAHPMVVAAIRTQVATLATHTRYLHDAVLDYAEQLTGRLPRHLNACIFVNSGSEANDVAWRMAKFATGRTGALVMAHAYHGITDAVAALTPGVGQPQEPRVVTLAPPREHPRFDTVFSAEHSAAVMIDVDAALATLAARGFEPAAFYIDTAITSSGVFDPPSAWARAVESRLRGSGALIVADEVQYGLGRSGSHFWGFERRGLRPDIVTMGKPIGNGYPMGVVVANRELIEAFQAQFGFFSTFGGNAVAAAAGAAVLRVLDREALMANALDTGGYLRELLEALAARHEVLGALRGAGLLLGLDVIGTEPSNAKHVTKQIVNRMASRYRVLIGSEGPHASILKIRPPMPFRREHADRLAEALDEAATEVVRGGS